MKRILSLLLLVLFTVRNANAQAHVFIRGSDSLMITILYDSTQEKKISLNVWPLKINGSKNYFGRFKEINNAFYDSLLRFINVDSIKLQVRDSVKRFDAKGISLELLIAPSDTIITGFIPRPDTTGANRNTGKIHGSTGSALPVMLIITAVLVSLTVVWLVFGKKISRILKKSPEEESGNDDAKPQEEDTLPKELVEKFSVPKQMDNTMKAVGERIIEKLKELEQGIGTHISIAEEKANEAGKVAAQLQAANERICEQERAIDELKQALMDEKSNMSDQEKELGEIKKMSRLIIDRYITDMTRKVREMSNISESKDDEIRKLLLENLFTFAFHSESLLKKLTKSDSEHDEMNIRILEGVTKPPYGIIHDNVLSETSYPLPMQVYNLLKRNGVNELKDVYIQGYKIGK